MNLDEKGKIDFKLPDDVVYKWDLETKINYVEYRSLETGWYDVGNVKYIFKLSEGQAVGFLSTHYGPEPITYLERKEK